MRADLKLWRAVLQREVPHLMGVPYDHDDLLPTTWPVARLSHALMRKVQRRFNRHLRPAFREHQTLYADYESYLRNELRGWAETILFDGQLASCGIFDMGFVRSLFERHCAGREPWLIGKIAPVMTYAKMLQKFKV